MKIKALVTTLVLGSSSLALADHAAPSSTPIVRDHRQLPSTQLPLVTAPSVSPPIVTTAPAVQRSVAQHPVAQRPVAQSHGSFGFGWQRPARPLVLANDTHLTGRALIQLPQTARSFTKLELRSNRGRTSIDRVLIVFGNGKRQIVELDAVVNGKKSMSIDLPGGARNIKSVMLIGNSRGRATIDVLAV